MAIQRTNLIRVFDVRGVRLADPDPGLTVQKAVQLIAMAGRPELLNAEIRGPETEGGELVYTLHRAVGVKGMAKRSQPQADEASLRLLASLEVLIAQSRAEVECEKAVSAALTVVSANRGESRLPMPSGSVPWLG